MLDATVGDGVVRLRNPGTEWLSTGWRGGRSRADAAYSVTVPDGWHPDDVGADVAERVAAAGFGGENSLPDAPVLLTGVDARHARGARLGPVTAVATAGVSNPAELPMEPSGGSLPTGDLVEDVGTVNVVVATTRALSDGALANLVAVAAEAKAATLLESVGAPGTTSDAVVVASDPTGDPAEFSGSATRVGAAARACVREAVTASLDARYADSGPPTGVADAPYGVSTDARADVFRL
ncbi:adenosylcobinamide amidohydrolase [Haloarchaeobius sp. HRN-SO-5]|uniref:adenosylcobinamide amidohydrolase n=1 Tax=Haloarchaeobius sp. HRN-SO-5 TaxID=3446118 RepID=UPI003EBAF06A